MFLLRSGSSLQLTDINLMREHYHMILPSVQLYKIRQLGENRDYNIIAQGWGF